MVVGCGRSGTTLLTVMLDSHPALAMPAETGGFVLEFCGVPVRSSRPAPLLPAVDAEPGAPLGSAAVASMLDELERWDRYRLWGLDRRAVHAAVEASAARTRVDVIRAVYRSYAASQGKDRYGDKTPNHVLHMHTLSRLFPEAVFVHLVRDGRSVALALQEMSFGPSTASQAATYWAQRVNMGRNAGRALGPNRYVEVRYEDLISEPERELRRIVACCGLDFEPAMLRYDQAVQRQLRMSPAPQEDRSLTLPLTSGLRDWRTQMPDADVAAFEMLAGRTLRHFGYYTSAPATKRLAHPHASLRAAGEAARWYCRTLTGRQPVW